MTAKIFQFPSQSGPNLVDVENRIRATLFTLTGDRELEDQVSQRMVAFIKKYTCKTFEPSFNIPLPPMPAEQKKAFVLALQAGVDSIAEQVYDMVNNIVKERLLREVEIYEDTYGMKTDILGRIPGIFDLLPEGQEQKINYLVNQLKKPDLKPQEKFLLNKLLQSVLEEKLNSLG